MEQIESQLIKEHLPNHLAIIMDGNGRWAKSHGYERVFGHKKGTESVIETVENVGKLGIQYLTLYAFSTENWNRPKREIDTLMNLLISSLKKELKTLQKNSIKLIAIGCLEQLPKKALRQLSEVIEQTKQNENLTLALALSYGAREEIVRATKAIALKVKNNIISIEDIDQSTINNHLYTQNLPDVDLLIRTSGELRISNFLLWQSAYAEFYFTDVLWPDFRKEHLVKALLDYQKRERRFGKISEQLI
ncbi:MAG: di-trans,poly-cis-decaprenylcistransferase [Flavobacteriales bacterium CG_4_9_14_3_um_filter_40_17]|nr:MAG: di-trans,poly-cis-decaprenylcistransferase [Flavobacteriales bacterium CG_4_9_14_3_um_filter_40_17]